MASRLLARAKKEGLAFVEEGRAVKIHSAAGSGLGQNPMVLDLRGDIIADSAAEFEREISGFLGKAPRFVVFDFTLVDEIGPAGIGLFVALKKRLRAVGADLVLAGLRPRHQKLFATLGFDQYFASAIDVESAIGYIEKLVAGQEPLAAACPVCGSLSETNAPGRGRCRVCRAVYTILEDGSVELG